MQPTQQPTQQQQQQQPPNYPQYPQSTRTKYPVPVSVVVLLVITIMLSCAYGIVLLADRTTSSSSAVPTAPTATLDPAIFAPTLGGTTTDFLSAYTLEPDSRGLMYAATIAGQRVLILLTLDAPAQSTDNQAHVAILAVQVPGDALGVEHWSAAVADQIAATFLPSDARFLRATTINPSGSARVTEKIYHSDALASTFHADQFSNDSGTASVPVGTFSYSCEPWPPSSAGGFGQCLITIGSY